MSIFNTTRTAKTVGKNHLSIALKTRWLDYDQKRKSDREYHNLPRDHHFRNLTNVVCAKYGWHEDHHLGLGVPYIRTDLKTGKRDSENNGFGNVFLFEKWNVLPETNMLPGVSLDTWFFFPSGDSDRKLGSSDSSVRFTAEVSKAWKYFSLHFNPGYTINCGSGPDTEALNGAILFTPYKTLWPAVEYNYHNKDEKGEAHDIIPGIIWKFAKGASIKVGAFINAKSTMTYREEAGVIFKIFYRF